MRTGIESSGSGIARPRPFRQVDVFTSTPCLGNPVAVVLDGGGLTAAQMLRFTRWTNLSEATFVVPPTKKGADYRVRIFCPDRELPFAGHPTLGTCHAWLEAGGRPADPDFVAQECGAGLVKIARRSSGLAFAAPALRRGGPLPADELALLERGLGLSAGDVVDHAWCDNGPPWQAVLLRTSKQVLSLRPDAQVLAGRYVGVAGPARRASRQAREAGTAPLFEVRAFFPGTQGLCEDPVTGSLNAALAQWLIPARAAPETYVASQGTSLGRAGRVRIERDGFGQVWVGGDSVTCVRGEVVL